MGRSLPVLVVLTTSACGDLVAPTVRGLHFCQAWRPTACWCDERHAPSDLAELTVVVGPPSPAARPSPHAIAIAVTPFMMRVEPQPYSSVMAAHGAPFGAFAATVLRNVVDGLLVAGLIGYDLVHLRSLFATGERFELASAEGNGGLVDVGRPVIQAVKRARPRRLHVGLRISATSTLSEINEIAEHLASAAADGSTCLFHATHSNEVSVSVLFSV